MEPRDDEAWFDGLAGRESGKVSDATRAEAFLMRRALQKWRVAVDEVAADDPARLASLIERARASGLFAPRAEPNAVSRPRRRFADLASAWFGGRKQWAAFASLCLAVALGFVFFARQPQPDADVTVERAGPGEVVTLTSADPRRLKAELIDALAKAGITAHSYTRFGREGIDADLPQQPGSDVRALLARSRISMPADGVLRVEIVEKTP